MPELFAAIRVAALPHQPTAGSNEVAILRDALRGRRSAAIAAAASMAAQDPGTSPVPSQDSDALPLPVMTLHSKVGGNCGDSCAAVFAAVTFGDIDRINGCYKSNSNGSAGGARGHYEAIQTLSTESLAFHRDESPCIPELRPTYEPAKAAQSIVDCDEQSCIFPSGFQPSSNASAASNCTVFWPAAACNKEAACKSSVQLSESATKDCSGLAAEAVLAAVERMRSEVLWFVRVMGMKGQEGGEGARGEGGRTREVERGREREGGRERGTERARER